MESELYFSGGIPACVEGTNLDSIYEPSADFTFTAKELDFTLTQVGSGMSTAISCWI